MSRQLLSKEDERQNNTLYIYRGIAITLMVLGHSGISQRAWGDQFFSLFLFLYLFHMGLFFFYSGFFFNLAYLDSPKKFFVRKIVTLYYPMLKWGVFFILLRNSLIPLHLSNQEPFSCWSNFWHSGFWPLLRFYDTEQMMGAFWFVRVLFFTNIIFFGLAWLARAVGRSKYQEVVLLLLVLAFAGCGFWMWLTGRSLPTNLNRELCVMPLFYVGYLCHKYQLHLRLHWSIALVCLAWLVYAQRGQFLGIGQYMFVSPHFFYLSSFCGIYLTLWIATVVSKCPKLNIVQRILTYLGRFSFDIMLWHFFSFKVVSLVRIYLYSLPIERLSDFPIIEGVGHYYDFIAYTIVGVSLPLLIRWSINRWVAFDRLRG